MGMRRRCPYCHRISIPIYIGSMTIGKCTYCNRRSPTGMWGHVPDDAVLEAPPAKPDEYKIGVDMNKQNPPPDPTYVPPPSIEELRAAEAAAMTAEQVGILKALQHLCVNHDDADGGEGWASFGCITRVGKEAQYLPDEKSIHLKVRGELRRACDGGATWLEQKDVGLNTIHYRCGKGWETYDVR